MHDNRSGRHISPEGGDRGLLLAGLVIDGARQPMVPDGRTASGSARYYVSATASSGARIRIPAARLDRNVIGVLRRIGLLHDGWQPDDLVAVVRCVVVTPDTLELRLDMRACLVRWRIYQSSFGRVTVAVMLRAMGAALVQAETLCRAGSTLHLFIPRYSRNRCAFGRRVRAPSRDEQGGVNAGY
jgi:hypothetical protein